MSRSTNQTTHRRWTKFSLQTLLVLFTATCIAMGLYVNRAIQQKRTVLWAQSKGGYVQYEHEEHLFPPSHFILSVRERKPGIDYWKCVEGIKFPTLTSLSLTGVVDGTTNRDSDTVPSQPIDLKHLAPLTRLKYLSVDNLATSDLKHLSRMTDLRELQVGKNQVDDLTALQSLTKLERLQIEKNQVTRLQPLARLENLEYLRLDCPNVSDLKPLAALSNLERLDLENAPISDLTPLARLPMLRKLILSGTQADDWTPLAGLTDLEDLWIDGTNIDKKAVAFLEMSLPNCDIRHDFN